ncbi:hypothetical protein V5799_025358 [Amblyomma americanum]|uniref:LIM zinc-binding domain-containing protein n=1 Tax=Amblyomma americanum TaxID=6943 RepID=A0AAQ4E9T8_AMBAM
MSAMPQQRDVAMFELGLRDYGSSWTRLQEALKVQQQLYGPVKQDELPQPIPGARSDDGSEEKAVSKSKSRAGLIGLITRKKEGKKKGKRASKSPERKSKDPSSEEDSSSKSEQPMEDFSLKRPARKELPALFARTLSSEKGTERNAEKGGEGVPDTPRQKSQSPKSFSRVSESFDSDERLSLEEFRNNGDTGSPSEEVPNGGKRRQASPVDNGHWGLKAADDQNERKNARAPVRTPRGQKRESPTREKDVDIYRRHRKHSFRDFFSDERYDENFSLRDPQRRQNEQVHKERPLRQRYSMNEPPYRPEDSETVTEQSSAKLVDDSEPHRPAREIDRIVYRREPAEPLTRQSLMRPVSESEPYRQSREVDRANYRRDGEPRRGHSLTRPNGDVEPHRPSREAERANCRREEREAARGHSLTRPVADAEPHRPSREVDRYRREDVEAPVERPLARPAAESGPHRPSREADKAGYRREQVPRGHSQTRPPAEAEPHRPPREADRANAMHRREPSPHRQEVDDGRVEQPVHSAHSSERRMRRPDDVENIPREEPLGRLRDYGPERGRLDSNSYKSRQQTDRDRANNDRHSFRDDAREKNKDRDEWEDGRQQRREGHAAPDSARPQGCTRCGDRVYPKEMVTPKPGVLLHSGCFKCRECGVKLTLQTFFTNQRDTRDTDVYCRTHVPRLGPGTVDGNALNILTSKNSREIKFSRYPKVRASYFDVRN